jgi:hypothetical protein
MTRREDFKPTENVVTRVRSGEASPVSLPGSPSRSDPTFETFETRILDDHGGTVSGPVTVTTGDRNARVIATSIGFACCTADSSSKPG